MSFVVFEIHLDQWFQAVDDIAVVNFRTITRLEQLLNEAFEQTQQDVHVITGSLRGSGKTASRFDGQVWEGEITYGGDSPGFPNDPVEYAEFERARGGDHDFLRNVHVIEDGFLGAIEGHFNV